MTAKYKFCLKVCGEVMFINTRSGDGLKLLFAKINPRIIALANKYYVDGETNDDKIQNLHIKILAIIPKYDATKSSFFTYINRCLENFIRNEIERNNTKHNVTGYITNYDSSLIDQRYYLADSKDEE